MRRLSACIVVSLLCLWMGTCSVHPAFTDCASPVTLAASCSDSDGTRLGMALMALLRVPLTTATFRYSGGDFTGSTLNCASGDEATGIGPFSFSFTRTDDLLVTLNTNLDRVGAGCGANDLRLRLHLDGVVVHTSRYARCWGQAHSMSSAFVVPGVSFGAHTLELRVCGDGSNQPVVRGAYPTTITATALGSVPTYLGRAAYALPVGTTSLPVTTLTPILDSGTEMAAAYSATADSLLWRSLSLGGGIDHLTNLRIGPGTAEDLTFGSDGIAAAAIFSYETLSAGSTSTAQALYTRGTLSSIVTSATFDNTLNLIAFADSGGSNYGKASTSSSTGADSYQSLLSVPITATTAGKYLIAFSALRSYGNSAGNGCVFGLFINGTEVTSAGHISSGSFLATDANIISIETIPVGSSIAVEIRFHRTPAVGTCTVASSVLTVIPLENTL